MAVQDRVLQTKRHETKLFQTETGSKYRLCKNLYETAEHINQHA